MIIVTYVNFGPEEPIERAITEQLRLFEAEEDALRNLYNALTNWLDTPVGDDKVDEVIKALTKAKEAYVKAYQASNDHLLAHRANTKFLIGLLHDIPIKNLPKGSSRRNAFLEKNVEGTRRIV